MAALSAAPCAVAASVEAQMRSAQVADVVSGNLGGAVESRVVEHPSESPPLRTVPIKNHS